MPKFDDYTQKTTPEDTDIALILDKTANVNKKTPFSGIWNWIVKKLAEAVIEKLQTSDKTIIGALNELNSKTTLELIGTIELTEQGSSNKKTLPYTTSHKMLYIEYGMKNATQVYGGSNICIYVNSSRPCFLPVYANNVFVGILYIYNNTETGEIVAYNHNIEGTVFIKVYAYV